MSTKETAKVRCDICGKEFGVIMSTHPKKHGIAISEYKCNM